MYVDEAERIESNPTAPDPRKKKREVHTRISATVLINCFWRNEVYYKMLYHYCYVPTVS